MEAAPGPEGKLQARFPGGKARPHPGPGRARVRTRVRAQRRLDPRMTARERKPVRFVEGGAGLPRGDRVPHDARAGAEGGGGWTESYRPLGQLIQCPSQEPYQNATCLDW